MGIQRRVISSRLAGLGIAVLALAACTQKSATGSDTPVTTSAPMTSPVESSTPPMTTTPPPTSTAPPTSSTPVSTPPTSTRPSASPTATLEKGGCPTSALTVRAIRGSGAAGHQFAFLQFTNNSASTCSLTGYPGVQLLLGGQPLGAPATRSGQPISTVQIAPGTSATANITVDSACNASISDSVQVIPPNRTDKLVLKLALRGCAAVVDPVAAS